MDNEAQYKSEIIKQGTEERPKNKDNEDNDETDEILALLQNEKYEILPDITSKS